MREQDLRARLGIPPQARRVLILAESSHWDPNWRKTSDEYFDRYVRGNLDRALSELALEPRRIYSVECVFFLKRYWDARPEQHEAIRQWVNTGRLRLTSSGVTTADTLLPRTEAILRDFVIGQEWLSANEMVAQPQVAYFPDSFGHSPCLPSLLNAAGFRQAAITRIDGMYFPGCDLDLPARFQWEGSSAARLMRQERSLDFVWRDPEGGEVLCHWNAFTYGQGDLLAHNGVIRIPDLPLAFSNRSDWNVTRHIHAFSRQLEPYARTPYLFCPIGFDFVAPIPHLVALLDRYNARHYDRTGLWVVNAGLDDYLSLVESCRADLPVVNLDPNPYWTGFYSARPRLKEQCHAATDALVLAEAAAALPENGDGSAMLEQIESAWWQVAVSNHHDFITGTATDRVVEHEQRPWLEQAAQAAAAALAGASLPARPSLQGSLPLCEQRNGIVRVGTPAYTVELAAEAGGCIMRAWEPGTERKLLLDTSNDLVVYADSGGLWRMGHEFTGGRWQEVDRAGRRPGQVQAEQVDGCIRVTCAGQVDGRSFTRRLQFRADSPIIWVEVEGEAAEGRTVTLRLATPYENDHLAMDVPGGVVDRPTTGKYDPNFWLASSFVHLRGRDPDAGIAVLFERPAAVAYRPGGRLELITHRNATREKAFGLIPLPGMPVTGHERGMHTARYGILFTRAGDWSANGLPGLAHHTAFDDVAARIVQVDHPGVRVSAVIPSARGLVIRLSAPGQRGQSVRLTLPGRTPSAAFLCDARERNPQPLSVSSGSIQLTLPGSLATVRVIA